MPLLDRTTLTFQAPCCPPEPAWSELLDGLSVYQDVLWAGRTARRGVRDVAERWRLIAPYLPERGLILDVGSNFGWYGLTMARTRPGALVLSVEADERSANVQRRVLASHAIGPVCLTTRRATAAQVVQMQALGQRFDAALCLSVLHWMPDHCEYLTRLAAVAAQIFVELPAEGECHVGLERVRREIGPPEQYLREHLPQHQVIKLGEVAAHDREHCRALWRIVGTATTAGEPSPRPAGLDVAMLCDMGLSWPPRSWWQAALREAAPPQDDSRARGRAWLTAIELPRGGGASPAADAAGPSHGVELCWHDGAAAGYSPRALRRRLDRISETTLWTRAEGWRRRVRCSAVRGVQVATAVRRRLVPSRRWGLPPITEGQT